jgi:hypothetical protein
MDDLNYVDYSVHDIYTIIHVSISTHARGYMYTYSAWLIKDLDIYIYILLTLVDDTYIKICFYLLIILLKLYDEREEYDFSRGNISFKSRTIYDSSAHRVVVS